MEPEKPAAASASAEAAPLAELLHAHEERSQHRYENLMQEVGKMNLNEEKVNIHLSTPQQPNDNGALLAAMLGNRSDPALLAAMSANRSDPALLAAMMNNNNRTDPALIAALQKDNFGSEAGMLAAMAGGGFGNNNSWWPLLLLLGLGRGRGGLFGGDGDGAGVAGLNNLQGAIDTNAILSNLADIKAQVPLSACEVMGAITAASNDINTQTLNQTLALTQQANQNQLSNVQNFANTGDKIDALSTAVAVGFGTVNTNIERTGWQVSQIVKDDGEKTRALITSNQIAELNRIAAERQDEIIELRNDHRRQSDRHGIEIQMVQSNNQNQLQFQAQAQAINNLSNGLFGALQNIRSGNAAVNIGGTQQANPTNTNTNNSVRT